MIPDPLAALVAFLQADSDVTTLVDTRVYALGVSRDETDNMPRKTLVLNYAGGGAAGPGANDYIKIQKFRVDVFCYGEDSYQASRVRLAVRNALKQMRRNVTNSVLLLDAVVSGGPIYMIDQETKWPFFVESWLVTASEVTIT